MAERDTEAVEETARQEMADAITKYARLTGYLDDDHILAEFVVATFAESIADEHTETGVITSHPMAGHQIHGLLDFVDKKIVTGQYFTSDDVGDDGDDYL